MIPLAIVRSFCAHETGLVLAAFYPGRALMETVLLMAEDIRTGTLATLDVSRTRLEGLPLPCVDSRGNTLLARAELVIERDYFWWTGHDFHGGVLCEWETQPLPLQALELDARQQGPVRQRAWAQLIDADFCDEPSTQDVVDRILSGQIPFPAENGKPLSAHELMTGFVPVDLAGMLQHRNRAVRENGIVLLAQTQPGTL